MTRAFKDARWKEEEMPGFHEVRALTANDAGRILREDGNLVGRISVRKDGVSVSFFYRYRWGDQNKEHSCGSWPRKSLMDIRKARNQARTLIDEQINPNEHKKIAKAHLGLAWTLSIAVKIMYWPAPGSGAITCITMMSRKKSVRGICWAIDSVPCCPQPTSIHQPSR
ncbi:hypothetical protein J2X87_005687 [Pseudomonas synxantha]|uniref:Uncharacterized protein n=1 Tax=Pseudomonas synxantha TaxID=47883 RepID=A0ACC6JW40_9PSED|nr:hypothetical protein [Pseudomonas synxantha]